MDERVENITQKFHTRKDCHLWDLKLTPNGRMIHIEMKTNDAYLKGRNVWPIRVEKKIRLDEDDHITDIF